MRNTGCSWPIATIYVMQGEIYSDRPYGQHGSAEFSVEMLLRNARNISSSTAPSGRCRGFTRCRPRSAKGSGFSLASAGRTARRRSTSLEKSSTRSTRLAGSKPRRLKEFRPSPCPWGGVVITEFKTQVPGKYTLLDHTSRERSADYLAF
jgi:nitrite reductase (NO-forming)